MDNKLYSEQSINYDTANHFVKIPDKISFFGLPLEISKTFNDISAFFIQPNSIKNNIITSVSDVTDPKNPTIILLLVPLVGYILIRSKETRSQFFKPRQALSFCFIVILISSIVITPLSISSAYWHAYAEDINNTKSESVSAQHTSAAVQQTSNATQNTGSNTENPIVNSITSSIDKNKPIDEPKTLPAPTNYNLPINTTSLKIPTNSTTNTNATSPVPTNTTTQKTSATATSLPDMIRITDAIIVYVNSSIHINATSLKIPTNATLYASTNATSLSDDIKITDDVTVHLSYTTHANSPNQIQIPNATKSWQFNSSTQNSTAVGNIKIEKNANGTSLNLIGQGYLQENVNATRTLANLTLSAWIKPDYSQGSSQFTVISKENTFMLAVNNNMPPPKKAIFSIFDGIKCRTDNSTSSIPQQWTYLAATFNRTSIGIYVNGKLESSLAITGVPKLSVRGGLTTKTVDNISSNADIVIGAHLNTVRSTTSNLFSGSIQDVKLYDSLLGPSQIAQLYENNVHAHLDIKTIPNNSTISNNIAVTDGITLYVNSTTPDYTIPINATSLSDDIKITDGITLYVNSTTAHQTITIDLTTLSDDIKITDGITLYVNSTTPDYTIPINATSLSDDIKITDAIQLHLNYT